MLIVPPNLPALFTGYKALYNTGFTQAAPQWPQIASAVNSTAAVEVYPWMTQFPNVREWTGDRHIKSLKAYAYSLENKDFEVSVAVSRNAIDDMQLGLFSNQMQGMGDSMARHPDKLVFQLLAKGDSTIGPDNQLFFDTDHDVGGASVSNFGGGAGAPWVLLDTSRPLKPLIYQLRQAPRFQIMNDPKDDRMFWRKEVIFGADSRGAVGFGMWQQAYMSKQTLSQANFEAAYAAFMMVTSDEGDPLGVTPNLLVVGPANAAAAAQLIEAQTLANGATNLNYKKVSVLVSPWMV